MILTLFPLQDFSSRKTDFHLLQFLSNFLRYSASNFPSSHPYSNLAVYFPNSSLLLHSFHSYRLTSAFNLPSNSSTNSLAFSKSSFFSHVSFSAINSFHRTKYFSTPLTFLLFSILSTFHSSTPSISIGFPSFFFCPPTYSLYCTIQLTFTTGYILIEVGSRNLTILVDTISLITYGPMYRSTNFLAGLSLNTRSLVLSMTLSPLFQSLVSFLPQSACLFISSCTFFSATPTSLCTFFILSTNATTLSTFPFFLMSPPFSVFYHNLSWKATPWLLYEPCCSLQTLPMPTTLASPSAYDLQRILNIAPTPSSFVPSAYLSVGGTLSITLFLSPAFGSIL